MKWSDNYFNEATESKKNQPRRIPEQRAGRRVRGNSLNMSCGEYFKTSVFVMIVTFFFLLRTLANR
jgi:hypothetical protein